jgi:hypothetical protein
VFVRLPIVARDIPIENPLELFFRTYRIFWSGSP